MSTSRPSSGTGSPAEPGSPSEHADLDARGQRCPLPVIALARLARDQPPGTVLTALADDPAARHDIPAWARMRGHTVTLTERGDHTAYRVVVGGADRSGDGQDERQVRGAQG